MIWKDWSGGFMREMREIGTTSIRFEALFLTNAAVSIDARRYESAEDDQPKGAQDGQIDVPKGTAYDDGDSPREPYRRRSPNEG
jgi:hypothetical protein